MLFLVLIVRLVVVAANTFVVLTLRSPLTAMSRIVRNRGGDVARGARRVVCSAGILAWWHLTLFNLGILTLVQGTVAGALQTEWQLGAASISVREIGTFLLVLFGAWALSRVLRTLLAEEILPSIQFPRGVPDGLRLAIDRAFREAGIAMPFAQADVHLHLSDTRSLVTIGRPPAAEPRAEPT